MNIDILARNVLDAARAVGEHAALRGLGSRDGLTRGRLDMRAEKPKLPRARAMLGAWKLVKFVGDLVRARLQTHAARQSRGFRILRCNVDTV